jgi:hypothetical protein
MSQVFESKFYALKVNRLYNPTAEWTVTAFGELADGSVEKITGLSAVLLHADAHVYQVEYEDADDDYVNMVFEATTADTDISDVVCLDVVERIRITRIEEGVSITLPALLATVDSIVDDILLDTTEIAELPNDVWLAISASAKAGIAEAVRAALTARVTVVTPLSDDGREMRVARGNDYFAADLRAFEWVLEGRVSFAGATAVCRISTMDDFPMTIPVAGEGIAQTLRLELSAQNTELMSGKDYTFEVVVTLENGHIATEISGAIKVS